MPSPGKATFIPKTLATSVSGSRIALKTVSLVLDRVELAPDLVEVREAVVEEVVEHLVVTGPLTWRALETADVSELVGGRTLKAA